MPRKKSAKSKQQFPTLILIIGMVCIIIAAALYFKPQKTKQVHTQTATQQAYLNPTEFPLLIDAAVWYPSAPWIQPTKTMMETSYGNLSGASINATITAAQPNLIHFEDQNALAAKGFMPDTMLSADGPGSSVWGYKKTEGDKAQILLFSYRTQPTKETANEPIQFNCPCKIDVTVFESSPFTPK